MLLSGHHGFTHQLRLWTAGHIGQAGNAMVWPRKKREHIDGEKYGEKKYKTVGDVRI